MDSLWVFFEVNSPFDCKTLLVGFRFRVWFWVLWLGVLIGVSFKVWFSAGVGIRVRGSYGLGLH